MSETTRRPLRVVVIGGVGQMGRYTVRKLSTMSCVSDIAIADIDLPRAEVLSRQVGAKTRAVHVDATSRASLDAAMKDIDVVINMLGPYNIFGKPILLAAIENHKEYIDVCDDWEATVEALTLDDLARQHQVRAIIGLGLSPGITNILAAEASSHLDAVDDLITGWSLEGTTVETEPELDDNRPASGAVRHWILQCSGQIQAWENGEVAHVAPLQPRMVNYPGAGEVRVYSLGHPEPITLPRTIAVRGIAINVMSGPEWIFDQLRAVVARYESGELSLDEAAETLVPMKRPEGVPRGPRDTLPGCWAQATGRKDGKYTRISSRLASFFPHGMGGNTGFPAALGVQLLAEGRVENYGVQAPEQVATIQEFADLFASHVEPAVDAKDLLVTTIETGSEAA